MNPSAQQENCIAPTLTYVFADDLLNGAHGERSAAPGKVTILWGIAGTNERSLPFLFGPPPEGRKLLVLRPNLIHRIAVVELSVFHDIANRIRVANIFERVLL